MTTACPRYCRVKHGQTSKNQAVEIAPAAWPSVSTDELTASMLFVPMRQWFHNPEKQLNEQEQNVDQHPVCLLNWPVAVPVLMQICLPLPSIITNNPLENLSKPSATSGSTCSKVPHVGIESFGSRDAQHYASDGTVCAEAPELAEDKEMINFLLPTGLD